MKRMLLRKRPVNKKNNKKTKKIPIKKTTSVFKDKQSKKNVLLSKPENTEDELPYTNSFIINAVINYNLNNFNFKYENVTSLSSFCIPKNKMMKIDGILIDKIKPGSKILVYKQTNKSENGIYTITFLEDFIFLTRSKNFNSAFNIINGSIVSVSKGNNYQNATFILVIKDEKLRIDKSHLKFKLLTNVINKDDSELDIKLIDNEFIFSIPNEIKKDEEFKIKSKKKISFGNNTANLVIENDLVYIEDVTINGDLTIGTDEGTRLIINSEIESNIIPADNYRDIGSQDKKWRKIYAELLEGQVSDISNHSITELVDIDDSGSCKIMTNEEREKLEKLFLISKDTLKPYHINGLTSIGSGCIISNKERETINSASKDSLPNSVVKRDKNNSFSATLIKSNLKGNVEGQVSDISNHITNLDQIVNITDSGSGNVITYEERELLQDLEAKMNELRRKLGLISKKHKRTL
jgi:hypothetical protein